MILTVPSQTSRGTNCTKKNMSCVRKIKFTGYCDATVNAKRCELVVVKLSCFRAELSSIQTGVYGYNGGGGLGYDLPARLGGFPLNHSQE